MTKLSGDLKRLMLKDDGETPWLLLSSNLMPNMLLFSTGGTEDAVMYKTVIT